MLRLVNKLSTTIALFFSFGTALFSGNVSGEVVSRVLVDNWVGLQVKDMARMMAESLNKHGCRPAQEQLLLWFDLQKVQILGLLKLFM